MGLRDQILQAADGKVERVTVAEWGIDVFLRVMSGAERDAFDAESYEIDGNGVKLNQANTRARLLVRCLCDEQGKRILSDDDAEALGAKSGAVLDRLFDMARQINRMTREDQEKLEKNSGGGRGAASSSGSPAASA